MIGKTFHFYLQYNYDFIVVYLAIHACLNLGYSISTGTVLVVSDQGVATVIAEGIGVSGCTNLAKASGQVCGPGYATE